MECWPEKFRPYLAGVIGAAANVGFALVAVLAMKFKVTEDSWRWVMMVGAAPALLTFLIRLFVPESERWKKASAGATQNPLLEVISPRLLKHTIMGVLLAGVALIGTWGSVQWIPAWVDKSLMPGDPYAKAYAQFFSAAGAILGCLIAPIVGNILGRRTTYFLMCLASLAACGVLFGTQTQYNNQFLGIVFAVGCITASFYGWLPLYLPELFPTRVRATGQGVSFNGARVLAAGAAQMGGILMTNVYAGSFPKTGLTVVMIYVVGMGIIWLAPETKGQSLPE
jgi:MFS transporter, SHS family, sialic acid transporter